MSKKISTTGQLREFLTNMLVDVAQGRCDLEKARNATKIAAQINESFYSEIKIAKVMIEGQRAVADLGELPINKVEP